MAIYYTGNTDTEDTVYRLMYVLINTTVLKLTTLVSKQLPSFKDLLHPYAQHNYPHVSMSMLLQS